MTFTEYLQTLSQPTPPDLPSHLLAMWYDARDDWNGAHDIAQDLHDKTGSWIHAYLHRKEGDIGNASYWYMKAGRPVATDSLKEEWERIVRAGLSG